MENKARSFFGHFWTLRQESIEKIGPMFSSYNPFLSPVAAIEAKVIQFKLRYTCSSRVILNETEPLFQSFLCPSNVLFRVLKSYQKKNRDTAKSIFA